MFTKMGTDIMSKVFFWKSICFTWRLSQKNFIENYAKFLKYAYLKHVKYKKWPTVNKGIILLANGQKYMQPEHYHGMNSSEKNHRKKFF